MTDNAEVPSEGEAQASPSDHALAAQRALKAEAKALASMATALGPLTKPKTYEDLKKAVAAADKVAAKVPTTLADHHLAGGLVRQIRAELDERLKRVEEGLGKDLAEGCKARGMEMRVISRDGPVLLRVAPFGVSIDRAKGKARIEFAKEVLVETAAEADAILRGHELALKALNTAFDAASFHADCFRAWQAARAALATGTDRVEIVDFLPYLALQQQKPAFRQNPTQKSFRDYGRAQFAWDILRLKRARGLLQDGKRLNLGVATGASAFKKSRVIFFEDEEGDGEFKLNVYFTKESSA